MILPARWAILPQRDGLTSQLTASYISGKLTVTAHRDAGWQQPALFIDSMEDVDFGKPSFTTRGDTLTATVPVTDSWGRSGAGPERQNAVAGAGR